MILQFPIYRSRHVRTSDSEVTGRMPNKVASATLPARSRASAKIEYCSAGMRPRVFQLETADGPTLAKRAASALPPKASMISPTVLSMPYEYSHSVNMSTDHISEIEAGCELSIIHTMDTAKSVAKRLVQSRDALGIKSAELCRQIDVAPNRWSQYENGKRMITLPVAVKLCGRYGLTLDWIYRGDRSGLPQHLHAKIAKLAA